MVIQWSFWIGSLIFPITLLTINCLGRWSFGMEQSAAGDLILLFAAFDGAVILQAEDFAPFNHYFRTGADLRSCYLVFFVFTLALWAFAVFQIERRMQLAYANAGASAISRGLAMIAYIGTSAVAVVVNTAAFTVRP